jgi:hypothetical protein
MTSQFVLDMRCSFCRSAFQLPQPTHSLGYLTMSKWAQQIREAKGPTLKLVGKRITATDCVEIARALEVISNVSRRLSLAHTTGWGWLRFSPSLLFASRAGLLVSLRPLRLL